MKNILNRWGIWLSGVDTTILRDCPQSEHNKYSQQGALIMIPPIMAFISMLVFTSLLTDDETLRILLSTIWAVFILFIDRYAVTTFHKHQPIVLTEEEHKNCSIFRKMGISLHSAFADFFSLNFIIRIAFATALGILISHPITVHIFRDIIAQEQNNIWGETKENIQRNMVMQLDSVNKPLQADLEEAKKDLRDITTAITAERSGKTISVGKYYTSASVGQGSNFHALLDMEKNLKEHEINLQKKIDDNQRIYQHKQDSIIAEKEQNLALDYFGKTKALQKIVDEDENMMFMFYFIIVFFVLLDVTAILLKAATKFGEYDEKLSGRAKMRIAKHTSKVNHEIKTEENFWSKHTAWKITRLEDIFRKHSNGDSEELLKDVSAVLKVDLPSQKREYVDVEEDIKEKSEKSISKWELLDNPFMTWFILSVIAAFIIILILPVIEERHIQVYSVILQVIAIAVTGVTKKEKLRVITRFVKIK